MKIAILCVPFILDYFGRIKMGMHRFLIAKTYIMESKITDFHIIGLKTAAVLIFIFVVIYAVKRSEILYALFTSSFALNVILFFSKLIDAKVYYFYIICFASVTILCLIDFLIKVIIGNMKKVN